MKLFLCSTKHNEMKMYEGTVPQCQDIPPTGVKWTLDTSVFVYLTKQTQTECEDQQYEGRLM
jgi:hypothetical protein